jgi:hypothetical protein
MDRYSAESKNAVASQQFYVSCGPRANGVGGGSPRWRGEQADGTRDEVHRLDSSAAIVIRERLDVVRCQQAPTDDASAEAQRLRGM